MNAPVVDVLLPGRSLTTPEGSLGFCGTYLVTSRTGPTRRILVDPGHGGRRTPLISRLEERGVGPEDVDTVVLSHAHWDHAQNIDLFPHARVLVHADEWEAPADGRPPDRARPAWTAVMLRSVSARVVADGQELAEGVRVLHLPGHTAGSLGVVVETASGTTVLSGDAVSRRDVARRGRSAIAHFDGDAAERSVRAVLEIADEVWPGHDLPFAVRNGVVGEYLLGRSELEIIDHAAAGRTERAR